MTDHRVIEDFCMIGTAVPESTKDVRTVPRLCNIGYSPSRRELIRVFPLAIKSKVTRWTEYVAGFERDGKDGRLESWSWDGLPVEITGTRDRMTALHELDSMAVPSIAGLNLERRSIGIIRPTDLDVYVAPQDQEEERRWGVKTFPYRVRARFSDGAGAHDLSVLEWGCYEFMRKYPGREHEVGASLHVGEGREVLLLVGNLRHHRTAWCVVSVLSWSPQR